MTTSLGNQAEQLVAQSLIKNGFTIVERNYKKSFGEIDVIAQKGQLLAFVEVKMRTRSYFDLADVVTPAKQKKIIRVASEYLVRTQQDDKECRFDVALVELENNQPTITYITNAFE
jgi:putative endonuclease